jgi:hypothetical protein
MTPKKMKLNKTITSIRSIKNCRLLFMLNLSAKKLPRSIEFFSKLKRRIAKDK